MKLLSQVNKELAKEEKGVHTQWTHFLHAKA